MRRRYSTMIGILGVCLFCYPFASNEFGRLRDREFEQLRQAYGPLTYAVHDKTIRKGRGRDAHWVELRLVSGSHGLPAWGVRLDRERWEAVQIGDRWEGAAYPQGSPTFQRSVEGVGEVALVPYLPLGGLAVAAAWFLRRWRRWR